MGTKKLLIVNADDFGLCEGFNQSIVIAHTKGILTSASILVTTPSFQSAVKLAKSHPHLGIGIHLSLTWGRPVSKCVPLLTDKYEYLHSSFARILISSLNKDYLHQVNLEFRCQLDKLINAGIKPDHINSHQHVHMIPEIFKIVKRIATEYKVKHLRIPSENLVILPASLSNITKFIFLKFLCTYDSKTYFTGVIHTTKLTLPILQKTISKIKPGITELLSHPGSRLFSNKDLSFDFSHQNTLPFINSVYRKLELFALISPEVMNKIKHHNIKLINYSQT